MRLISARIRNFKLLEDVEVDFSTDPKRPLTMIRAENGSGKTSFMYALSWGLFGQRGLPDEAQSLRLISSNTPSGDTVTVTVEIVFESFHEVSGATRYRLLRSTEETPRDAGDQVVKGPTRVTLERLEEHGNVAVDEAVLHTMMPPRLKDVFFTNGDDVQTFIAGGGRQDQSQTDVKELLRALLAIDKVEATVKDIDSVRRKYNQDEAKLGGGDLEAAHEQVRRAEGHRDSKKEALELLEAEASGIERDLDHYRDELDKISGIEKLDEYKCDLREAEAELSRCDKDDEKARKQLRLLLTSEFASWQIGRDEFNAGLAVLDELSDRRVIPGASVEVLRDRIDIGECICGESLDASEPGGRRRIEAIRKLIEEQTAVSTRQQRLSRTLHVARASRDSYAYREEPQQTLWDEHGQWTEAIREVRRRREAANARLARAREALGSVDDEKVRRLRESLRRAEEAQKRNLREQGIQTSELRVAEQALDQAASEYESAQKKAKQTSSVGIYARVARDLHHLASKTLESLREGYVQRIAQRTSDIFLSIVGSSAEFEASVFTGVRIDPKTFHVIVETRQGRQLNPYFEVNGASQRALTLAFIWAVTEISGTIAPRIIDTPLGMVAGEVKRRMFDFITTPVSDGQLEYQVVLLLTPSEIRDLEDLLDERTGVACTLSCNKDYPEDLRFDWGLPYPIVRVCGCSHRESCEICARKLDAERGVQFIGQQKANA